MKVNKLICLLLFCLSLFFVNAAEIEKSNNDKREYDAFIMPNGLKVFLVSDMRASEAFAQIVIHAGLFDDFLPFRGLAHFTEHMLFFGSEKYPASNIYQDFIKKNNGITNATTAKNYTNYFFSVEPSAFPKAFDIFAELIKSPILAKEYINKERNAVDSEFQMRKNLPFFKFFAIFNKLSNPAHPARYEHMGNLEYLRDYPEKTLYAAVREFHDKNYRADNSTLLVIAPNSLSDLKKMVVDSFSNYKKSDIEKEKLPKLFRNEDLGKDLKVKIDSLPSYLSLFFNIPKEGLEYKSLLFLKSCFQAQIKGGLIDILRKENIANFSNIGILDYGNSYILSLEFQLIKDNEQDINLVTKGLINYFKYLTNNTEYLRQIMQNALMFNFNYQTYQEPSEYSEELLESLKLDIPLNKIISYSYIYPQDQINKTKVGAIVQHLTPENLLRFYTSDKVQGDKKEEDFNTEYSINNIDKKEIESTVFPYEFSIDINSKYIADNDELKNTKSYNGVDLVYNNGPSKVWLIHDNNITKVPQYTLDLRLINSDIKSIEDIIKLELICGLLNKRIRDINSSALSLVNTGFLVKNGGIVLRSSGRSDKLNILILDVIEFLKNIKITPDEFTEIINLTKKNMQAEISSQLKIYKYLYKLSTALYAYNYTLYDYLENIDKIDINSLQNFCDNNMNNLSLEYIYSGNIDEEEAVKYSKEISESLISITGSSYSDNSLSTQGLYVPDEDLLIPFTENSKDNVFLKAYIYKGGSVKNLVELELLTKFIERKYFDELRTAKQFGYVVHAALLSPFENCIRFMVESPHISVKEIEEETDKIIKSLYVELQNLDENHFEEVKSSYIKSKGIELENSVSSTEFYANQIFSGQYEFNKREEKLRAASSVTKKDLLNLYKFLFQKNSRVKTIFVFSHNPDEKNQYIEDLLKKPNTINNVVDFKKSIEYYN